MVSMMNNYQATITLPSDRETAITRTFNAPKKLVWEALTKPEHVRRWYGLRSNELVVCEIDLRVGGKWRYVMRAPDGNEYAFSGTYQELSPPDRLVSTELFEAMPGSEYLATMTLTESNGKTTLKNTLLYQAKEHRDGHIASGMEHGMNETFNRLDELLARLA
jgi:uncharacterized protein YndB with AHSA1/START domain